MGTFTSGAGDTSTQVVNIKVYGETSAVLPTALRNKSDGELTFSYSVLSMQKDQVM